MPGGGDYLAQVVNEMPQTETLPSGRVVRRWKMVNESVGNHYWDCEVYARAAAHFLVEGNWGRRQQPAAPAKQPAASNVRQLNVRRINHR